mmetsp:Transcript_30453/g.62778  ORF Transcript_30453/g.62778 Transcript_30453/m.62778 type:complete len:604 (+) Transcript_30453:193-2004(+)
MRTRRERNTGIDAEEGNHAQQNVLDHVDLGVGVDYGAPQKSFTFDGKTYASYQEMVEAKRKRNQNILVSSGLLDAKAAIETTALDQKRLAATGRGLKRSERQSSKTELLPRRKSSRIAGVPAPGIYVDHESSSGISIGGGINAVDDKGAEVRNFNNRVNDGSDLTVAEAVEMAGSKWIRENTVKHAETFMGTILQDIIEGGVTDSDKTQCSPVSVAGGLEASTSTNRDLEELKSKLREISLDDDTCVAKVTPERIYSVACHPSPHQIIACAGDKSGHIGIWNFDQYGSDSAAESNDDMTKSSSDDVHLFKPHGGAVSSLKWNSSGTNLLSCSYDGSVRAFDANKQVFQEIFATYDDNDIYKEKIGYNTDRGYSSWVQSMELDHRYGSDGKCFFLSTSEGSVIHVDLRSKAKITFNSFLSEKKINTISLHPNGYAMATAGLSTVIQLWDLRNMGTKSNKGHKPFAWQNAGKSINSAYFSPSGSRMVTTTMSNNLDILKDAHTSSGLIKVPEHRIRHDNMTGRWLSTFMACWHNLPICGEEVFLVGSMQKPRTIEIFSGRSGKVLHEIRGEALTAVASRCCFHPSRLVVVGGNSSGRVTVAYDRS